MRRPGPRPLSRALADALAHAAPGTLLASVQSSWGEVAGPAVAAEAEPVAERGGTVTLACRSAVWANELELMAPELIERLNGALGGPTGGPVRALRFRIA